MTQLLMLFLIAVSAGASDWQVGFVKLENARTLYTEHLPAERGQKTLVLLNGLTFTTDQWSTFAKEFRAQNPGTGILLYDMYGMGRTLEAAGLPDGPIAFASQAEDLRLLLQKIKLPAERTVLVGLSYGGGVALKFASENPALIRDVVVMAPFVEWLSDFDPLIRFWISGHRLLFPLDSRSGYELFDHYLKRLVTQSIPEAEPIVNRNPDYIHGIYELIRGAKDWDFLPLASMVQGTRVHLVAGERDQVVKLRKLERAWDAVPAASRGSFMVVENAGHKIPWDHPELAARWIARVVANDRELSSGRSFRANPCASSLAE